jgi:sugar lactone lactonase YvrE
MVRPGATPQPRRSARRIALALTARRLAALALVACCATLTGAAAPEPDLDAAMADFRAALAAQEAGDAAAYRASLERAAERLADPTRLLYRLAGARLADGDPAGALAALAQQIDAGFVRDPRGDPQFAPLADDAELLRLTARMDALFEPKVASEEVFRIGETDLLAEGIAHDPLTGSFFFSSVHKRKILRRTADGKVTDFVPAGAYGLAAALGLAVDAERGLLWIVSAGLPHARGLADTDRDRSALLAVDLDSGALRRKVESPHDKRLWNDLALAADGTVYVSDPGSASLARVATDGTVTTLVEGRGLRSPGGLSLSADDSLLYVADWSQGLAVVELASGEISWPRPPANATLLGIDGLHRDGDTLVAIHNGVTPHRIIRYYLAGDGRTVASAEWLERHVPEWDEPTLGVVVDGALVYVANSQWPKFPEDGSTPDAATLAEPAIRRLPLARDHADLAR